MQPDPSQGPNLHDSVVGGNLHTGNVTIHHHHTAQEPETGQMAQGFVNQQVMMMESKSSLPVAVGVIFCIFQGLGILAGLMLAMGGAFLGGLGGEEAVAAGGLVAGIGVLILIISGVGIWAGVMIAQRKKLGIYIAWGLLAASTVFSILTTILGEMPFDWASNACNGICALFVALPLMISSASQHME